MPYKLLTLLIFTILFPVLIAGSTVLLLKSGLVDTGKSKETSPISTNKVIYPEFQPVQTTYYTGSDILYYTGKIDGKIPFRVVLDSPEGSYNPLIRGKLIYDGESEYGLNTIAEFIPSNNKCERFNCGMEIKVFDPKLTNPNNDDGKLLSTFTTQTNLLENPEKITGTWTKAGTKQKLKFELNRSEEFNIEDYLVKYNEDKTLYIDNQCVLGHKVNANCNLFSSKYKTKITELISCKTASVACFSSVYFGKKIGNEQYIFIDDTVAPTNSVGIYKFNILQPDLELVGSYAWGESLENLPLSKYPPKDYEAFREAEKKYSLPKP